ncbi:MAG: hypothetical protein ACFFBH_00580 [Promethearchaeota archaeon]
MENNADYYQFLDFVNKISKKAKLIQTDAAKIVYENYNLCIIKKELEMEIQKFAELLSN